jgi:hypothetical protein
VNVFNGATSALMTSFLAYAPDMTAGVEVAAADVTGDGIPDIIAAPGPGAPPLVRVFDGKTGVMLREFMAMPAAFSGGLHIAAGDVNGDGYADIIVGSGLGVAGTVKIFDGVTNALVRTITPFALDFGGGVYVGAGDVNGDGYADIIAGAGPGGGPIVRVFDGQTGKDVMSAFYAFPDDFTGGVRVAASDVDGDGKADLILGAGPGAEPTVRVLSGATGAELWTFDALSPDLTVGTFVSGPPAPPLMAIDLPTAGTVTSPVRVAGWVIEEASVNGAGVDAIHAWAFPVGGGAPIFVGASAPSQPRTDIAGIFGGEFLSSGFILSGPLPAGTYDLVVQVRNAATGRFDDRRVVRLTVK